MIISRSNSFWFTPKKKAVRLKAPRPVPSTSPVFQGIAYAFLGSDTFSTTINSSGNFLIGGVPAGVYTVCIIPDTIYQDTCFSNVVVGADSLTDLGLIQFWFKENGLKSLKSLRRLKSLRSLNCLISLRCWSAWLNIQYSRSCYLIFIFVIHNFPDILNPLNPLNPLNLFYLFYPFYPFYPLNPLTPLTPLNNLTSWTPFYPQKSHFSIKPLC